MGIVRSVAELPSGAKVELARRADGNSLDGMVIRGQSLPDYTTGERKPGSVFIALSELHTLIAILQSELEAKRWEKD
jgi:hypothetical protein